MRHDRTRCFRLDKRQSRKELRSVRLRITEIAEGELFGGVSGRSKNFEERKKNEHDCTFGVLGMVFVALRMIVAVNQNHCCCSSEAAKKIYHHEAQ